MISHRQNTLRKFKISYLLMQNNRLCTSLQIFYMWSYDMATSALLAIHEVGFISQLWFPRQMSTNSELWYYGEHAVWHTVDLLVVWYVIRIIWRHCSVSCKCPLGSNSYDEQKWHTKRVQFRAGIFRSIFSTGNRITFIQISFRLISPVKLAICHNWLKQMFGTSLNIIKSSPRANEF